MLLSELMIRQGNWLFRRRSWLPWLLLPFAVYAFLTPAAFSLAPTYPFFCLAVAVAGQGVRALTVGSVPAGTSGRTTTAQRAEALNTTGLYSLVRHPLYVGNFLIFLGFVLLTGHVWFIVLAGLAYWVYYERIMLAEEEFLLHKFGDSYRRWARTTPAILPHPRNWTAPVLPFCWRTALRREYTGFFLIVVIFSGFQLLRGVLNGQTVMEWAGAAPFWPLFFILGTALYLGVRTIRKTTGWLAVRGR